MPIHRDEHLALAGELPQQDAQLAGVVDDQLEVGRRREVVVQVAWEWQTCKS